MVSVSSCLSVSLSVSILTKAGGSFRAKKRPRVSLAQGWMEGKGLDPNSAYNFDCQLRDPFLLLKSL